MMLTLQDVIVTAVAMGAAVLIAWRVLGSFRSSSEPRCASCPSAVPGGRPHTTAASDSAAPLVFHVAHTPQPHDPAPGLVTRPR